MSELPRQKSFRLAEDDAVWLYKTDKSQDLIDLIDNPYEWVKNNVRVTPNGEAQERPPILLDNFVISMDVATSDTARSTPSYLIDGIDGTGFITVRMATAGGRFCFDSGIRYHEVEEKILQLNQRLVVVKVDERIFFHLDIGKDPDLRKALLAAAIENQTWLSKLYGKLDVTEVGLDGCKTLTDRKLKLTTIAPGVSGDILSEKPQLAITFQGSKAGLALMDACNIGSATTIIKDGYYIDSITLKVYAAVPN